LGGNCAAAPRMPTMLVPSVFFVSMVGHEKSVGCVGVFGQVREREMRQRRGRKPPFPACNASRGRR